MISVGFTGTQRGMTPIQMQRVRKLLRGLKGSQVAEFHHGDCIGSDEEAWSMAYRLDYYMVSHPPENPTKRAMTNNDEEREPKPYLARNHDIVNEADVMIATPGEDHEVLRSGTWATIRYAARTKRKIYIVFPNGEIKERISA